MVFKNLKTDLPAGIVVWLIALPLCLGVALASGAPLFSGIISGIVGGIVVGALSGSSTSVSGPAAGLTAIVLAGIASLNNYPSFLLAVVIAGALQIVLGSMKAGVIAEFMPSNVIKGLLAAIGIILILKQIPHAFGYDADAVGDFAFMQLNHENTFSAIIAAFSSIQPGATLICLVSVIVMLVWDKTPLGRVKMLPAPLIVVLLGVGLNELFMQTAPDLIVRTEHLVSLPVTTDFASFLGLFTVPDFSAITSGAMWRVAVTLALVATIETLLNLEATDKLDPQKRLSPPNRELFAQGFGNMVSGLIGGIPVTSVIVRSSANINSGAKTKAATIIHGTLLLASAVIFPTLLNRIPLSCLAAILILIGYKLAKVSIFKDMYSRGWSQFLPFIVTVTAIVFTDLLIGIAIGLTVSLFFILKSNFSNPFNFMKGDYHTGEIIRLELAPQVSFFNKPSIRNTLAQVPRESELVIDASGSDFIDFDVLETIEEFRAQAPSRGVNLSLVGFKQQYQMADHIQYVQVLTEARQAQLTPPQVLDILMRGNARFAKGDLTVKDLNHQIKLTANNQFPMAAILGCIDSRVSNEMVFDVGLGDLFSVRVAGNVINDDILGSLEYACAHAGAKMIVVLGHSNCGAVKAACNHVQSGNLTQLLEKIQTAVEMEATVTSNRTSSNKEFVARVSEINIQLSVEQMLQRSEILGELWRNEKIDICGATYDVNTGIVTFLDNRKIFKRMTERGLLVPVGA